jgi:hypothetical protein
MMQFCNIFYLIRMVYIVSVIELIFITPTFDIAFPVRTTFGTVPTWIALFQCSPLLMHEIQRIPFIFFLYIHVRIILEQNHDRNAYKLFIFINVMLKLGPEV